MIGFVYLLGNVSMPCVYKIGCTERSPARRAEELSQGTGIPTPFDVLCYWEGEDYQGLERSLHEFYEISRLSARREFFGYAPLHEFVSEIENSWPHQMKSYCLTSAGRRYLKEEAERGPH